MYLPKKWSNISVEQFIEISQIDKDQGANSYNSELISIVTDMTYEEVEELDLDDMVQMVNDMKWSNTQPSKQYKHELLGMKIKPLSKLCLFEYIDLDYYFNDNYHTNIDKICAILYRQTKVNEWGEVVLETYDYDIHIRAEKFLDLPITEVYGIVAEFLKFRENFLDVYKNLFGEAEEDLTAEDKAAMEPEEIKEVEAEVKNNKWSWERMIYGLTDGDITKSEAVGALPLTYVFNMLGMKKELDI
jgi:hypothetical protein